MKKFKAICASLVIEKTALSLHTNIRTRFTTFNGKKQLVVVV